MTNPSVAQVLVRDWDPKNDAINNFQLESPPC